MQRIEKEFTKMLENNYYYSSIYLLYKYKYLQYFLDVDEFKKNNDSINSINSLSLVNNAMNIILTKSFVDKKNLFNEEKKDKQKLKIVNYACLFLPYKNFEIIEKNKNISLSRILCAKKFILPKSDTNDICLLIEGETELINMMKNKKPDEIFTRYNIGLYLMKYKYKNISDIITLAICEEYLNSLNNDEKIIEEIDINSMNDIINKYMKIMDFIKKEKMENIEKIKPLLDGKQIKQMFNIKNGKDIKKYIDILIKEQINNPEITKEECINIIKSKI